MGVILKPQRTRMSEYVTGLLETAGYTINSSDESEIVFVSRHPEAHPEPAHLFLHSKKRKVKDFKHEMNQLVHQGNYVGNIFYKDGENFHVRLAEDVIAKEGKSLKKYEKEDLDKMLHLRDLERTVLDRMREGRTLTFYQPETARLAEGLRNFIMAPVVLDYSHIQPEDRRYDFVLNHTSRDYAIAKELTSGRRNIGFAPVEKHLKTLTVIPPRYI